LIAWIESSYPAEDMHVSLLVLLRVAKVAASATNWSFVQRSATARARAFTNLKNMTS